MSRILYFQQITDNRFDNNVKELLEERITILKEKLNIEGVEVKIGTPYELTWEEAISNNGKYIQLSDKSTYTTFIRRQLRVDFYVKKNTKKITWNDIYNIVNSVKAVPYKFLPYTFL